MAPISQSTFRWMYPPFCGKWFLGYPKVLHLPLNWPFPNDRIAHTRDDSTAFAKMARRVRSNRASVYGIKEIGRLRY